MLEKFSGTSQSNSACSSGNESNFSFKFRNIIFHAPYIVPWFEFCLLQFPIFCLKQMFFRNRFPTSNCFCVLNGFYSMFYNVGNNFGFCYISSECNRTLSRPDTPAWCTIQTGLLSVSLPLKIRFVSGGKIFKAFLQIICIEDSWDRFGADQVVRSDCTAGRNFFDVWQVCKTAGFRTVIQLSQHCGATNFRNLAANTGKSLKCRMFRKKHFPLNGVRGYRFSTRFNSNGVLG